MASLGVNSQDVPSSTLLGAHPPIAVPITLAAGENLDRGHVLGKITVGAATAAAFATNAANTGTCGTVTVGAGAKAGVYKAIIIEPATNSGKFTVEDPDGITVGVGTVAAAFSAGGLGFTIADGATDFSAGEGFNITVAAGSGHYTGFDADLANGAQFARAILAEDTDATSAATPTIAYVHGEFNVSALSWDDATNDKTAGIAQLFAAGIFVR